VPQGAGLRLQRLLASMNRLDVVFVCTNAPGTFTRALI
jgi:glutamyl-tRNA reductase